FNGNVEPHWGEVWSKHAIDFANGTQRQDIENYLGGDLGSDPWTAARTEEYIFTSQGGATAYLDGRYHDGNLIQQNDNNPNYRRFDQIPSDDTPYYNQPFNNTTFRSGNTQIDLTERFYQHQTLD